MSATYDTIGVNYANLRQPDHRIAALIDRALGKAQTVINVGAGTGSYEPADRDVTAVEPSVEMISQRPAEAAPVVQGHAEDLPFDANAFDAAMGVLTLHHWTDQAKGCAELTRVARKRVVLLTFDPEAKDAWQLDYFPEFAVQDDLRFPKMSQYEDWLGPVEITKVPIPEDCSDGFLYAYWKRPHAYLDARVRAGISSFWDQDVTPALSRLKADLDSGRWTEKYGSYLDRTSVDFGYRLVTAKL